MNNHAKSAALFIALIFALGHPVAAQETAAPGPPYVAPLTGDFAITKKFTYTASGTLSPEEKAMQGDPANPVEVDMVKKGPIRKDTEHFLNGSGRDIWRVQAYRLIVDLLHPESVTLDMAVNSSDPQTVHYHDASDFPELSWITGSSYAGVQNQQGKSCYLYQLADQSAYIDASTHLPLYFQSKTVQVNYTYANPPDEPLQLPNGYAEKLAKFKRALRGQF